MLDFIPQSSSSVVYLFNTLCLLAQLTIEIEDSFVLIIRAHVYRSFLGDSTSEESFQIVRRMNILVIVIVHRWILVGQSVAWSVSVDRWRVFSFRPTIVPRFESVRCTIVVPYSTTTLDSEEIRSRHGFWDNDRRWWYTWSWVLVDSSSCRRVIVDVFVLWTWRFSSSSNSRCSRSKEKKNRFNLDLSVTDAFSVTHFGIHSSLSLSHQ